MAGQWRVVQINGVATTWLCPWVVRTIPVVVSDHWYVRYTIQVVAA